MAAESSKRFKVKPLWVASLLILSCVGLFFFQLFGPDPAIIVSKETTYITEPLGEDGLPDYEAFWVQQASEGVTPENNAAVLIWQALWPGDLDQEHWLLLCDALGMPEVPSQDESLVEVYSKQVRQRIAMWLAEQHAMPEGMEEEQWNQRLRDETADLLIDEAMSRPWTSEQIPPLAQWIKENQRPLDLLVEAAARPHYFSPSPSFLDGSDDGLIAMLLPEMQNIRTAVRGLKARAMHHLGEDRPAEAWEDLHACHRLARLTANNPTLVGQLVAIAVEGVACSGTQVLVHHADLSEPLARQILDELLAMPQVSDMARTMDQGERLYFLDSVLLMANGRASVSDLQGAAGSAFDGVFTRIPFDWNLVMRIGNSWYDRMVTAAKMPIRDEREQAFDRIDSDLDQLGATLSSPRAWIGVVSRNQRSKIITDVLLSLFLPAIQAASNAQDRSMTSTKLTRVGAALAVYRAQHGEYPEQLADLAPEILSALPLDLYSGKSFLYERKQDGGYLLYSVFENGADDGGTDTSGEIVSGEWVDEPQDVDRDKADLVIRMPVPKFRLPARIAAE